MWKPEGAIAAAVTPSRPEVFQMDLGASLELIDFLCARGVGAITLFGPNGEFPHFPVEDRIRLAHMAVKRSRAPVIVNATCSNLDDAVAITDHAASNGAAAVLIQPPFYYHYDPPEIREFFLQYSDAVNDELPVLLYHSPAYHNPIPLDVASDLLSEGIAAGIKDSSGDWGYFEGLLAVRAETPFLLLAGNESLLLRARQAGADAFISSCACAVPELFAALDRAIRNGNPEQTSRLEALRDEFLSRVADFPGPLGIKEALEARGLKMGKRAIPFAPATRRHAEVFRDWFQIWLPDTLKTAARDA
ncbi:MAG: dihydrodipicolinate synthase family protein [Bryobacterales bacterium]|nr:dihydrodipicolinate synthase family protein [Bryobacterales bacterium]